MPNADESKGEIEGVDSSHWQGTIVPTVGRDVYDIQWWAIKATEGTSYVDPTFKRAQESLRNAGIKYRGYYHFPRGNLPMEAQVEHFVKTVGPLQIGEFAKLDDEKCEPLGYGLTIEQAALWLRLVEEHYGRPCCEYTGAFYRHQTDRNYHWDSELIRNSSIEGERPNILPSYNTWNKVTTRGRPVHVWQWTSSAVLPGLHFGGDNVGRIDRDLVFLPHAYDLACGYVNKPTPSPEPEPEPIPIPIPTPIPTPIPGDDIMSRSLLRCVDADAAFFAWTDSQGIALQVEWTGSGDDPNVVARINAQMAAGCQTRSISVANLIGVSLIGQLPQGDSRHDWTGREFGVILG